MEVPSARINGVGIPALLMGGGIQRVAAGEADDEDTSLLGYCINPGAKVRNRIDFLAPTSVEMIRLEPAALEGGGWNWRVSE
ncbi:hypothetical protein [Dietzia psychralcaliphila]|uniref:hypothetical protein n=1 Tax=Dietzia psychralcaliphila TaxID=139021 RepID=UPI001C1E4EEC|nr:hypothetical protein [Dietzia psychralcaliphila]